MKRQRNRDVSNEQLQTLADAGKRSLTELLAVIDGGTCQDDAIQAAIDLYDALENIGEDIEDQSFDVELYREMLLSEQQMPY